MLRAQRSALSAQRSALSALGFSSLLHRREDIGASLSPWIELVRGEAAPPCLDRLVPLTVEPQCAPQLEVRFDQAGPQRDGLPKECLRVLEHVALEVHESEIEMCVERSLLVVVEADRARQVLDRLAKYPLLEANVADIDARERVLRLAHQDLLEHEERVVILLLQHQRPAEQRFGLRIVRREVERLAQSSLRADVIPERKLAPSFFDEGRRPEMV